MRLYRATDARHYTGTGSCWTPNRRCAEAYWDNPGFGGPDLLQWEGDPQTQGAICNLTTLDGHAPDHEIERALEAAGVADPHAWLDAHGPIEYVYQLWEDHGDLRAAFQARYAWIVYIDDYPNGCETWVYLGDDPLPYAHIATRPTYAARALANITQTGLDWDQALDACIQWAGYDEALTMRRDPTGDEGLFCFEDGSILRWTGQRFEIG